ncbi:hypothetical protein LSH36_53g01001 [Paralvinella palmiformis]|uniref:Dolichyl-diphosphooligosaccharide--protein glycosyltransferase subunit 2 n=1 Tax=Paralvinella palmiformis TaxID=53620 RepID=A0AAD9K5D6_9ANNE|nr:hypothetical protein LSH36_53g01001 [Paralvinella palmiformis]
MQKIFFGNDCFPPCLLYSRGNAAIVFCACLPLLRWVKAFSTNNYFTQVDHARFLSLFKGAQPYGSNVEMTYYSVMGYSLLEEAVPEAAKACESVKAHVQADVDSLFYATSVAEGLKPSKVTCKISLNDMEQTLQDGLSEGSPSIKIYRAVAAMVNLGIKFDQQKLMTALNEALKADDGVLSHGYAFLAASYLSGDLHKYHDLIEDVIAQADEVDDKYLQFEGGLHTTAVVIDGAYKLATKVNAAPVFTDIGDKVVKFANYFVGRKHVQSLKNAAAVLSVIKTLTTNKFHVPVAVTLVSSVSVSDKEPTVKIRISDLLGGSLGKVTVTADTARHVEDDAVIINKKQLKPAASQSSVYELDLMSVKPARGFYRIMLSLVPEAPDKHLIGTSGAEVEVKVITQVTIEQVEIGVADKEQSGPTRTTKLQYPNKAANVLEADYHQRVTMTFQIRDKAIDQPMAAHQAFIRLTNQDTKQEIFYVPEPDSSNKYRFDLDVGAKSKDFGFLTGKYTIALIVGDVVIENPLLWNVADVYLTFPEGPTQPSYTGRYSKKPEIEHMFAKPEQRPPTATSVIFTVLVLLPFIILFAIWAKLGANVGNFTLSPSAVGFHVGLGAIFGLYYCYWLNLSMFVTLKYLGVIGIPTFLFGNKLLSGIAAKRK